MYILYVLDMTVLYDGHMYLLNLHSYTCWKPLRLKTACVWFQWDLGRDHGVYSVLRDIGDPILV